MAVCSTSTTCSAPIGTSVSATIPTTPNRRLRRPQRTVRTHPKSERSKSRCASCLRKNIDCLQLRRRRSPSAQATVRMMLHTRHLHCAQLAFSLLPAARILRIESATQLGSTQLGSAQLGSTRLNSTRFNSIWLNSAQLNSTSDDRRIRITQLCDRTDQAYLD